MLSNYRQATYLSTKYSDFVVMVKKRKQILMDMKNVSKIAIGLWILSALILSLLKIFIAPNVGWDIIILAIGLILSLILGGCV